MKGEIICRIADMPEVLAGLRHEMAMILREAAEAEASAYVRDRLLEIAAAFESGQKEEHGG